MSGPDRHRDRIRGQRLDLEVVAALDEPLPQLGRDQPAPTPVEELRAELLLEAADALRQRRLREVEGVGGRLQRRVRCHGEQVSDVTEIDHEKILPGSMK